jgi:hypothetical protein
MAGARAEVGNPQNEFRASHSARKEGNAKKKKD